MLSMVAVILGKRRGRLQAPQDLSRLVGRRKQDDPMSHRPRPPEPERRAAEAASDTRVSLDTAFNLRGEPIVNTPADASRTSRASDMDGLVVDKWVELS